MNIGEVLRISWEIHRQEQVRALLTMLGIIIGRSRCDHGESPSAMARLLPSAIRSQPGLEPDLHQSEFHPAMARRPDPIRRAGSSPMPPPFQQQVPNVAGVSVGTGFQPNRQSRGCLAEQHQHLGSLPDFPTVRDMKVASGSYFTQTDQDHKSR